MKEVATLHEEPHLILVVQPTSLSIQQSKDHLQHKNSQAGAAALKPEPG